MDQAAVKCSKELIAEGPLTEAGLLANRDDGISDLVDGAFQLVFGDFQTLGPAAHGCFVIHGNMASGTDILADLNADHLNHSCLQQQIAAVRQRLARHDAIKFRVPALARRKALGVATCQTRQIFPVNRGDIVIVAQPHRRFLSGA
jgi:hypothetical protein